MPAFHPLTVSHVRKETDAAVCLTFDVPAELSETYRFVQGQYLTLQAHINGARVRRSYSICSGIDDGVLQVAIKRVAGGVFSTYANANLAAGDRLEVLPPQGTFFTALDESSERHYLCIAAGSGITPIISIIKTVLKREPGSQVTLLYGNRRIATMMFKEELEAIKNRYTSRFQWINVLSRERQDIEILNGRINNRKGAELIRRLIDLHALDEFFLCGPEAMISEVSRGLRAEGIDESRIHYELFAASAEAAAARVARHHERALKLAGMVAQVTVNVDGRQTRFALGADGQNVLDGALDNGVDLPFACKGGVCATCKAKLLEGEVDMDVNHALEADELAAGYILTCQSHPVSDRVVIDFDQ